MYNVIAEHGVRANNFAMVTREVSNRLTGMLIISASIKEKVPVMIHKNNRKMTMEAIGTMMRFEMTASVGKR